MLDGLWKVMIAALGAVAIAGVAAGTQLWAMPFPRVAFMTLGISFGLATMWAAGLYIGVKYIATLTRSDKGAPFKKRPEVVASAALTSLSLLFLTWHLLSGARAIGDVRWCLRNTTAWQCNVTAGNATTEQKKELERFLMPYRRIHWGSD